MNTFSAYLVPTCYALLFHALVAAALIVQWEEQPPLRISDIEHYYIEASMVAENPHRVRERREQAEAAAALQAQRDREAALAKEQETARINAERLKAERLEAERLAEQQRLQAEAARRLQEERRQAEEPSREERELMAAELALAVMGEQAERQAITDDEKAMAYAARIREEIVQNWSRPPSARNGMQALLRVSLVPTGEVVEVSVIEGSGNAAFDRSAVVAVEKVERFVVPDDPRQFERNFREFEVLFRPEDLRL